MDIQKLNHTLRSLVDFSTEIGNMTIEEFESFVCQFIDDFLEGRDENFRFLAFVSCEETDEYGQPCFAKFFGPEDAERIVKLNGFESIEMGDTDLYLKFIEEYFDLCFRNPIEYAEDKIFRDFFVGLRFVLRAKYNDTSSFKLYVKIDNGKSHSVCCEDTSFLTTRRTTW